MELAAATHHSAPKGGWPDATHNALRGQKSASSVGARPAALREPVPQLVSEHAACPCSSGAPPLSLPVLADRTADVVDSSSLRFLTASAVEARREEDEERQKREEQEELNSLRAVPFERRTHQQVKRITYLLLNRGGQEEKEEEEEEEASQNNFLSWPSTSGTRKNVSVHMSFLLFLGDGLRGEGLGIPSPFLGATPLAIQARAVLASAVFFLVQFVVGDMEWCGFFWLLGGECGGGSAVFSLVPLTQWRAEQVRLVLRLWTSL